MSCFFQVIFYRKNRCQVKIGYMLKLKTFQPVFRIVCLSIDLKKCCLFWTMICGPAFCIWICASRGNKRKSGPCLGLSHKKKNRHDKQPYLRIRISLSDRSIHRSNFQSNYDEFPYQYFHPSLIVRGFVRYVFNW